MVIGGGMVDGDRCGMMDGDRWRWVAGWLMVIGVG